MSLTPQVRTPHAPTARSDATRDRILSAAAATLSAKGYSESKLSDIANTAQLRPPAVYYYFSSRDELIAEVMRVGQQRVRDHVARRLSELPSTASALDRVCAAVEAHLRVELELSDFATAVTRNAGHVPPAVHEALHRESEAYHSVWRTLLQEACSAGELRADLDLGVSRMLVIGALNWATEWASSASSVQAIIDTAQSVVREGLGASRPGDPG